MAQLPTPSTNQPVDFDFINQLVTTVNALTKNDDFMKIMSTSSLSGKDTLSNKVVFHTEKKQISATSATKNTSITPLTVNFQTAVFSEPPIIITTLGSSSPTSFAQANVYVTDVTSTACNINIEWIEDKTSGVNMYVNILAIGPTTKTV